MTRRIPLYIVCSPRQGVGKTMVARLVAEFLLSENRDVEGFDLNAEEPSLVDFLPGCTTMSSVADTHGQMALFDALIVDDWRRRVVDLGQESFNGFFGVMQDTGFIAEARARGIEPMALFIVSADAGSLRAYNNLARWLPDLTLVPVYNEAVARGYEYRDRFPPRGPLAVPVHIPRISPNLKGLFERRNFSFSQFRLVPPLHLPVPLREEALSWIKRTFLEFREIELRVLLADLRDSLQLDVAQAQPEAE